MSKCILITGASTGIGAATAVQLAPGNRLFLHYNQSEKKAEKVASHVVERGGKAHLIKANLMNEEGCLKVFDLVKDKNDRLDVLVNNAGALFTRHSVKTITWELMQDLFALNTFSAMMLITLCIPWLEKGTDPSIVNLTSIAMRNGGPTATVYGAAKGAVDSFTRGAARELAPKIRVNAIAPGVVETPYHDKFTPPDLMEQFKKSIPLGHPGTSEQIALTVQFLVENSFITGETIDVNGGQFMR